MPDKRIKVALIGNPNSGKTSLFNHLTGLSQKVANFPGVTIDKKKGLCKLNEKVTADILDLPGTYSLYSRSPEERVVINNLMDEEGEDMPDKLVIIIDESNLKRNLLLFTQIRDLGIPVVLALNMVEAAKRAGVNVDIDALKEKTGVPVVEINARKGTGIQALKQELLAGSSKKLSMNTLFFEPQDDYLDFYQSLHQNFEGKNDYYIHHLATQTEYLDFLSPDEKARINALKKEHHFDLRKVQEKETIARYSYIDELLEEIVKTRSGILNGDLSEKIDRILLHKVWGLLIFLSVLTLIFQAIFTWSQVPMDLIDNGIIKVTAWVADILPESKISDLFTEGVIAGIGGVVIFIPQIAILFLLVALLEETGYMARVMFLTDKIMRRFGMNGRSVVPLISGVACAVPAIMSARTIENWKERIITIFVTPFISCSARLPVYIILIAVAIPQKEIVGFINLQGLVLLALYLLGIAGSLLTAILMRKIIRPQGRSYLILELPDYRMPRWGNVVQEVYIKVKTFVWEAGRIIVAISIILWVLASYGPGNQMQQAEIRVEKRAAENGLSKQEFNKILASEKLEASYAGEFGKFIEPVLEPLGYDWKIGIAIVTSFAAREVFVGTLSTIYTIGAGLEDEETIINKLKNEVRPADGKPMFDIPTSLSLLVFYVFAMQCMSTLAIVYKETQTWSWPVIQFVYMSLVAYVAAYITYEIAEIFIS